MPLIEPVEELKFNPEGNPVTFQELRVVRLDVVT